MWFSVVGRRDQRTAFRLELMRRKPKLLLRQLLSRLLLGPQAGTLRAVIVVCLQHFLSAVNQADGAGQEKLGIYIKSVVKGGAADKDGRLAAGDQLLSVDGRSLVGLSQERAAELMTRTGSVVTLEVAKQGAIYHGLATLLNQPSPMMQRASDRGRDKNGKMRPKSEGFELYNNAVQNGDPESPQPGWDSYAEPKKMSGEDRLLKNRADHRSSPNVANQGQSPATKSVYPGGPGTKITSVSTGNLCADDEPSPPRPEAYPIPTQTYPREYFTIPASKSQDRVVGPGPGPPQHWQGMEDRERLPVVDNMYNNSMQVWERRWTTGRLSRSQEHLNFSASSTSSNKGQNQKTGPGRWKTPNTPHIVPPHSVQPPSRSDLPPPPPPPPAVYPDPYDPQAELPLPPPPATISPVTAQQAADRKKREEQQRWYEKEKARLEEERERKRREQERKLGQIRANPVMPVQPHNNGGAMPPPHHQPPMASMAPPQPYHAPQPPPSRPEKLSSLPRSAVPPPAAANSAAMDTVIRELLPQQQPRTIERRDLQYITISKEELSTSDSLSPDPWKRDAREKAEKQQQLHIVDLLDKEIQELQAKPERTAEESDRLRKLMLEWQFQKRLQESKQSDEDEEEEDDEDMDAMLIMQRLEAEKRARQQTAVPAISVLDLLQDEERRRKQQLEEIRKREAEERVKQEEERRWREEERVKREAEEKRRQEEEYYTRLEAERRRQHEEAERKLLTPDEPAEDFEILELLHLGQMKPEKTIYPFLAQDHDLGLGGADSHTSHCRKVETAKTDPSAPVLGLNPHENSQNLSEVKQNRHHPAASTSDSCSSSVNADSCCAALFVCLLRGARTSTGFNSHTGNSTGVVGSGEVYNDPRDKWTKSQEQENSIPSDAPESLTFKERQRLFSQGKEVSNKVKASRKLMELENELNTKQ
ncbi:hypothetical protein CCH79_00000605 [Gambusia affinis]|uniref:PDZ domain-containing protein n=1 Tax=Gambusia affinis TaxID=33528 RepID=A0A315VY47_GAMAF|nr:hypothetical protein CCH79_00000605 [Gambusia affinis]